MIHVLFVSHELDLINSFHAQLKRDVHAERVAVNRVETTEKCFEYLEKMKHFEAALVISDVSMPEMDNLAFLKIVEKRFPQVKVYICSTLNTNFIRKTSRSQGALRIFSSPINVSTLYTALSEDFSLMLPVI